MECVKGMEDVLGTLGSWGTGSAKVCAGAVGAQAQERSPDLRGALESRAPPLLGGVAAPHISSTVLVCVLGRGGLAPEGMMGGPVGLGGPLAPLPRLSCAVSGRRGS